MTIILNKMTNFFERVGRARAASELAGMGYYTQAQKLMTND